MGRFNNIAWSKEFAVDIKKIDDDHKKLLKIFNDLVDIANQTTKPNDFVEHLSSLTNYSLEHFQREEILMRETNYPDIDEHELQHKTFIYKIAIFNLEFDKNNKKMIFELLSFLEEWLVDHIKASDGKLIQYSSLYI